MSMGVCVCVCDLILLACECIKSIINELCNRKSCSVSLLGKEKELTHNLICQAKKLSLKETTAKERKSRGSYG